MQPKSERIRSLIRSASIPSGALIAVTVQFAVEALAEQVETERFHALLDRT